MQYEEFYLKFSALTNLSVGRLQGMVAEMDISANSARDFYAAMGRFPNDVELDAIKTFGITHTLFLLGSPLNQRG